VCFNDCQIRNWVINIELHCKKSRRDTKKCYVQYSRFSCQKETLKQSPFQEPEFFWQHGFNKLEVVAHCWEEGHYTIPQGWAWDDFKIYNGSIKAAGA
jgi:hypothetical protein